MKLPMSLVIAMAAFFAAAATTSAMRRYLARGHDPGLACESDADLMEFLRERGGIAFHPSFIDRVSS